MQARAKESSIPDFGQGFERSYEPLGIRTT